MRHMLKRWLRDTDGATGIEYALLAAMLAIGVVAAVEAIHTETEASFVATADAFAASSATLPTP